jgi:hypothetical protein
VNGKTFGVQFTSIQPDERVKLKQVISDLAVP